MWLGLHRSKEPGIGDHAIPRSIFLPNNPACRCCRTPWSTCPLNSSRCPWTRRAVRSPTRFMRPKRQTGDRDTQRERGRGKDEGRGTERKGTLGAAGGGVGMQRELLSLPGCPRPPRGHGCRLLLLPPLRVPTAQAPPQAGATARPVRPAVNVPPVPRSGVPSHWTPISVGGASCACRRAATAASNAAPMPRDRSARRQRPDGDPLQAGLRHLLARTKQPPHVQGPCA